jgi:hypothetical protein
MQDIIVKNFKICKLDELDNLLGGLKAPPWSLSILNRGTNYSRIPLTKLRTFYVIKNNHFCTV